MYLVGAFKPHLKNMISSNWVHLPQGSRWTSKYIWNKPPPRYSLIPPPKKWVKTVVVFQPSFHDGSTWAFGDGNSAKPMAVPKAATKGNNGSTRRLAVGSWQPPGGGRGPYYHCWWQMATRNFGQLKTSWGEGSEYPMIYEGFCTHARWLFGMFFINSTL